MGSYQAQVEKMKKVSLRKEADMKKTHMEQIEEVFLAIVVNFIVILFIVESNLESVANKICHKTASE